MKHNLVGPNYKWSHQELTVMENSERPVPWLEMLSAGSRVGAELPEKIDLKIIVNSHFSTCLQLYDPYGCKTGNYVI